MEIASALTAVTWIGAGLLILAGVIKFPVPDGAMAGLHSLGLPSGRVSARVLGAAEILIGLAITITGGVVAAGLTVITYTALTVVAARQRAKQVDCGCFGVKTYPVSRLHLGVNAGLAVTGTAGLWAQPLALGDVASEAGVLGMLAGVVLTATAVGLVTTSTERAGQAEAARLVATR
ncbi:MauE/DoxX family redox-associated membrane protein [Euzebya tangerina]|uniref:MauE/DoxX family redox-associated membrane protein n=1 Tax=Euzebya tangerina TaxID=591198 RepID=UPI000E31EEF1|nr:MauE/DoxX family redox-associated membrane protein [Euzebya tangerina]